MITVCPEFRVHKITPETNFLFIACDGIWDCLSSQEGVDICGDFLKNSTGKENLSKYVADIFDKIVAVDVASSGNALYSILI